MSPCTEVSAAIRMLRTDGPVPGDVMAHVADCEACARLTGLILLRRRPSVDDALDEDDAVLVAADLATAEVIRDMRRARELDPSLEADWRAIEARYTRAPRSGRAISTRSTVAWLVAAAALVAVGGGLLRVWLPSEAPIPSSLVPRGDEPPARYELAIGEPMRYCRPGETCLWSARGEPLMVHYRGQAAPLRVTIHDARGERSQLYPDPPDTYRKPSEDRCPADQWCVVDGGLYSAPVGAARLCVETAPDAGGTAHCFDLEVID